MTIWMSMKFLRLSDFDGQRRNNFTLIRLVFSLMVLWGHAWPITGHGFDPLSTLILPSTWIGGIAVNGFFVISGFLVTASFINRSWSEYALSRALRIYPAIIVVYAFMVGVLGPCFTTLSILDYFVSPETWTFTLGVALLDLRSNLPGVFLDRPFSPSVNGSLWTVILELRAYVALLVIGLLGAFRTRSIASAVLGSALAFGYVFQDQLPLIGIAPTHNRQYAYFLVGALLFVNRDAIHLSRRVAAVAALLPWPFLNMDVFPIVLALCLVYVLFVVAYAIPHVNLDRFGDYSYGIYIYAWPVQQAVWHLNQTPWQNGLISTLIVVPLSIASWHLVEAPALKLRRLLIRKPRMALGHYTR